MSQAISNRIYVAGLDGKVSASDLRTYFGKWGEMTDVYIPNNHQTGQPKHFGFVTFGDENAAQECMQVRTHEINGQPVELKPCVPKDQMTPKGGGKGDALAPGLLGMPSIPGLGMTMPQQSPLIQPALGGLQALQAMQQPGLIQPGLQALQQQYLMQQQQQLQQQQLLQFLAKMQQPQQFAQPNPMMPMQFGGCAGIPGMQALPADQGSSPSLGLGGCPGLPAMGLPAEQGTAPPLGQFPAMGFPASASETPAVASGMNFQAAQPTSLPPGWAEHLDPASGKMFYANAQTGETRWERPQGAQAFNQQQAFMGHGFPNGGAMTFGAPAMEASTNQAPAPVLGAVLPALTPNGQPEGLRPAAYSPLPSGSENPALAFGAVPSTDPGQGAARVAPY